MTLYIDKFRAIKSFVNLNIPHNKKNFTPQEKAQITRYYSKLEAMGYLDNEREGFVQKDISRSKYKIKNAPKIKRVLVEVGTVSKNGKISTDKTAKVKIINGKINVKRRGMPYKWEFEYNIKRDWKLADFVKHLKKQMLPYKPRKGQIFVIGAGLYEMAGSGDEDLEEIAKSILSIAGKYNSEIIAFERPSEKSPDKFMQRVIVYENREAFKLRAKSLAQKKRKTSKRLRMTGRN